MPVATTTKTKLTLRIPEDLYDAYAERAAKYGRNVETEIEDRLKRCVGHTSITGVYVDDSSRNELSLIIGKTVQTQEEIVDHARKAATIKVGEVIIPLDAQLLTRLEGRKFGSTLERVIEREVLRGLREFCGLQ